MTTASTPASFSTGPAPFALTNGGQLLILFNSADVEVEPTYVPVPGGNDVVVTFAARDVANIGAVTAQEVADAINHAATRQAAAGSPPAGVATVNDAGGVTVTSSVAVSSNQQAGQIIQVLQMSTELAALGVTAGLYYPSPYPGPSNFLSGGGL